MTLIVYITSPTFGMIFIIARLLLKPRDSKTGLKNQLGKLTDCPTLRWVFQCFQGIHLVFLSGVQQIVNLTEEPQLTLSCFPHFCQKYYSSSG